ncbi:MAG: hypothetical protein FWD93_04930, partial [Coriobacteriia bacterium]|nr:hypothetical protein [Coriobacteriia bacterium]
MATSTHKVTHRLRAKILSLTTYVLALSLLLMVLAPTLGLLADSTTMPIPALLTAAVAGADETDPSNTADEPEEERLVAPVVEPATDQIMPLDFVLYKVYRTPDGYAGLVSGGMDISEEQLPARFEVAVPAGVELLWF